MHVILNDREDAVLIDSLAIVRNQLREAGYTGDDNQSALNKINSLMHPDTYGLWVEGLRRCTDDNVTVTLSNDDYWRIRQALAESTTMHQKAVDRCKGHNQRSTDTILQHEHVMRRLWDVEDKLKAAAAERWGEEEKQS